MTRRTDYQQAGELAAQMDAWLAGPAEADPTAAQDVSAELAEWCRAARDVMARLATRDPAALAAQFTAFTAADQASSAAAGDRR